MSSGVVGRSPAEGFPPPRLVVALSLVGQIVLAHRIILSWTSLRNGLVLLGEVTGQGSDPPVLRT